MAALPALNRIGAVEAMHRLSRREITVRQLTHACLARIDERDAEVRAFTCLDLDAIDRQAKMLDDSPVRGALWGLPLGVKDLFDTSDLPTSYGSPMYANHLPAQDAAAVVSCREAGALVIGKTVTTEFAYFTPGPTGNPHDLTRTPGGSSSGSAAAVADFMVPLALGTQTAGSIIRPAAYCGVVGYKPSLGLVSRAHVKSLSETLDVVGGFARSVDDVGLLGAVLTSDARLHEPVHLERPRVGICRTREWDSADADIRALLEAVSSLLQRLGIAIADVELPAVVPDLVALHKAVMSFEMARALRHERVSGAAQLSPRLKALLDEGIAMTGAEHRERLLQVMHARECISSMFDDRDVLLAPSTAGQAPLRSEGTGDPLFCRGWTVLGLPCIHLPLAHGGNGLPIGLQLIGRWGDDHRLLACARWLHERLRH